jgi:antitoxin VapB
MKRRMRGLSEAPAAPISLNIKNGETCRLIQQLAELTGESMTAAVTTAVRERLTRIRQKPQGDLAKRLLAIGRDCAGRLGEEYRTLDFDALLYDEKGLPR